MAYSKQPQDYESSWPIESYLGRLMQDTSFLSHIVFPDMPSAQYTYHVPQPSYTSPPVNRQSHTQYSRTRGGHGSVGRKRKAYRESYGRYTTYSRNVTILHSNYPYRDALYLRNSSHSPSLSSVHLARKPRTWRKGYKSPSKRGLGKYLGNITSFILRSPPSFRLAHHLHPLISHRLRQPTSVVYDLHILPGPDSNLRINALDRAANALDFFQLATSPAIRNLLIWHPKLPWKIEIEATNFIGITIQDVLTGIYQHLRSPIGHEEFYTVELVSEDRELISTVFHERCSGDPREISGGVRRVDFLGREACFIGLSRSRNGTWEMKTAVPERQRMTID